MKEKRKKGGTHRRPTCRGRGWGCRHRRGVIVVLGVGIAAAVRMKEKERKKRKKKEGGTHCHPTCRCGRRRGCGCHCHQRCRGGRDGHSGRGGRGGRVMVSVVVGVGCGHGLWAWVMGGVVVARGCQGSWAVLGVLVPFRVAFCMFVVRLPPRCCLHSARPSLPERLWDHSTW